VQAAEKERDQKDKKETISLSVYIEYQYMLLFERSVYNSGDDGTRSRSIPSTMIGIRRLPSSMAF
jgi:hypothetical protein